MPRSFVLLTTILSGMSQAIWGVDIAQTPKAPRVQWLQLYRRCRHRGWPETLALPSPLPAKVLPGSGGFLLAAITFVHKHFFQRCWPGTAIKESEWSDQKHSIGAWLSSQQWNPWNFILVGEAPSDSFGSSWVPMTVFPEASLDPQPSAAPSTPLLASESWQMLPFPRASGLGGAWCCRGCSCFWNFFSRHCAGWGNALSFPDPHSSPRPQDRMPVGEALIH